MDATEGGRGGGRSDIGRSSALPHIGNTLLQLQRSIANGMERQREEWEREREGKRSV